MEPRTKILSQKRKESYLATSTILDIWYLHTSLWLIPMVNCILDMNYNLLLLYLTESPFTRMPLTVLFGLKIRYP